MEGVKSVCARCRVAPRPKKKVGTSSPSEKYGVGRRVRRERGHK